MRTTPLTSIPYPDPRADRWYEDHETGLEAIDTIAHAVREDRNVLLTSFAVVSYVQSTGVVTWDQSILLRVVKTGVTFTVAAGSVTLSAGQAAWVSLTRNPSADATLVVSSGATPPNDDSAFVLFARVDLLGTSIVFVRGGHVLKDGAFLRPLVDDPPTIDLVIETGVTLAAGDFVEPTASGTAQKGTASSTKVIGLVLVGGTGDGTKRALVQIGGTVALVVENTKSVVAGSRIKPAATLGQIETGAGATSGVLGIALKSVTGNGTATCKVLLTPLGG